MKKYDYLNERYMFWNPELEYLYDHKNDNPKNHFRFLLHICNYWTLEEMINFYKNNTFTLKRLKEDFLNYIFYKDNKEDLFRDNKVYFNKINELLKWLWLKPYDKLIEYDENIENEKKEEDRINAIVDNIIEFIEIKKQEENKRRIDEYFKKKNIFKYFLRKLYGWKN